MTTQSIARRVPAAMGEGSSKGEHEYEHGGCGGRAREGALAVSEHGDTKLWKR